ncbi:MAG: putative ABC exporter domain-containing protein [Oscillospiraceae bacterium]|jgi:hypothetical protein|nr:putative ABC exporter domain-containing protein [Oscillospiraceae bacterium]MCI1990303.1 putative ABC exporter domain-containing protein [Oscillospiraceae bacterium]MCI2034582.1 putative ABC exporter domain-containing protein [Oscillospiraceae bacterium]
MSALVFLVRKQGKNFFRDLLRHPGKLTAYLVTAGLFAAMLVGVQTDPPKASELSDFRMLHGFFLAWLLFLSIPTLLVSLKSGTTMFRMPDVNLLFVSPVSPKKILAYGLTKQMASTLLSFLFLLFWSGMLMDHFRITALGVVLLVVASAVTVFLVQVLSLLVYSFSNGNPKRKNAVRAALYAFLGAMVLTALFLFRKNGGEAEAVWAAVSSPYLEYFPIVGWAKGAAFALIGGDLRAALLYGALLLAAFLLCLAAFEKSNTDYYEDVLSNTETQFELRRAAKENRAAMHPGGKVKTGKTGIGRGWGANAFFYKHLCEARRRSRLVFLGVSTFVTLAADLALAFVIRFSSRGDPDAPAPNVLLLIVFAADVYILFLRNAAGDWSRELGKPYVYLVPENPFRKLLWASLTSVLQPAADGAVLFAVLCAAVHASPLAGLICFLGYVTFGALFTAGNILAQRVMGGMGNRGLVAFLFMLLLALVAAPGIGLGAAVFFAVPGLPEAARIFVAGLPVVGWNLLASLGIVFACRNLLSTAEMGV